jgi:hypothetical protein
MKQEDQSLSFMYSVIRVVPDPIRDEAINVGVIVADDAHTSMLINRQARSRIRTIQRSFSFTALESALADIGEALNAAPQTRLGEQRPTANPKALLASIAGTLDNQIRLTEPRSYVASGMAEAANRLFRRYVARRAPGLKPQKRLTHAELRERIWRIARSWEGPEATNLRVRQGGFVQGHQASHPADVVIMNGRPRAALFALPTHQDDRQFSYLYRDSLPAIAADMGKDFRVFAIMTEPPEDSDEEERAFVKETRTFLGTRQDVKLVDLAELPAVRAEVSSLLV